MKHKFLFKKTLAYNMKHNYDFDHIIRQVLTKKISNLPTILHIYKQTALPISLFLCYPSVNASSWQDY